MLNEFGIHHRLDSCAQVDVHIVLCSIPQAISINFFSSDSKRISDVIMKVFDAATTERYLKYVEAHTTILQVPSIIQYFL